MKFPVHQVQVQRAFEEFVVRRIMVKDKGRWSLYFKIPYRISSYMVEVRSSDAESIEHMFVFYRKARK